MTTRITPIALTASFFLSVLTTISFTAEHTPLLPPANSQDELHKGTVNEPMWRTKLNQQLEQTVTVDYEGKSLLEVTKHLANLTRVKIDLDPKVLSLGARPITIKVENMKLGNVLDFLEKMTGLNHTLREEGVYFSIPTDSTKAP